MLGLERRLKEFEVRPVTLFAVRTLCFVPLLMCLYTSLHTLLMLIMRLSGPHPAMLLNANYTVFHDWSHPTHLHKETPEKACN
ncbi:hypothetical protein CPC08DRAFT_33893 [Agrocybe pediades]|nr:hypothetical protein CPC08DRAFT_33893 [Agrocybe pediades]